jgi:hypothetical protein
MRIRLAIALPLDNSDSRSTPLRSGRDDKVKGVDRLSNCYHLRDATLTLSSRPERSGVEGPAVFSILTQIIRAFEVLIGDLWYRNKAGLANVATTPHPFGR